MTTASVLSTALAAADAPVMLTSAAQVARASKAWRRSPVLALDTEFIRERTYYAKLGLVQISDGQTVWLLDPLAEETLPPLRELLENPDITKLLHSPSEDLEVLLNVVGALPQPLVDTQLGCALLGQPLQMGYHAAAHWLLDIPIDKDQTRSNWCKRPLTPQQIRYAALDVCVLPMMWDKIRHQLEQLQRERWLAEDCERVLAEATQLLKPEDAWKKVRGHGRLDGTGLAILERLAAWREHQARNRDLPRGFVLKDTVLLQIASRRTDSDDQLAALEDLHPRARKRHGSVITQAVKDVLEADEQRPRIPSASPAQRKMLKQLRDITQREAEHLSIDPALLAARKDLEQLVFNPPQNTLPGKLAGWRSEFLGEPFLAALESN